MFLVFITTSASRLGRGFVVVTQECCQRTSNYHNLFVLFLPPSASLLYSMPSSFKSHDYPPVGKLDLETHPSLSLSMSLRSFVAKVTRKNIVLAMLNSLPSCQGWSHHATLEDWTVETECIVEDGLPCSRSLSEMRVMARQICRLFF